MILIVMIIKMFIDEIKKIESLEKVYLSPKDDDAKRFWSKCGFIEETSLERPSNMYDYNMLLNFGRTTQSDAIAQFNYNSYVKKMHHSKW